MSEPHEPSRACLASRRANRRLGMPARLSLDLRAGNRGARWGPESVAETVTSGTGVLAPLVAQHVAIERALVEIGVALRAVGRQQEPAVLVAHVADGVVVGRFGVVVQGVGAQAPGADRSGHDMKKM